MKKATWSTHAKTWWTARATWCLTRCGWRATAKFRKYSERDCWGRILPQVCLGWCLKLSAITSLSSTETVTMLKLTIQIMISLGSKTVTRPLTARWRTLQQTTTWPTRDLTNARKTTRQSKKTKRARNTTRQAVDLKTTLIRFPCKEN